MAHHSKSLNNVKPLLSVELYTTGPKNFVLHKRFFLWLTWQVGMGLLLALLAHPVASEPLRQNTQEDRSIPPKVLQLLEAQPTAPLINSTTPSQSELSIPSVWWAEELFGGNLVIHWLAYPRTDRGERQVNVIVSPERWARYSYLQRYAFVYHFGTVLQQDDSQLLVQNIRGELLAAYICDDTPHEARFRNGSNDIQKQATTAKERTTEAKTTEATTAQESSLDCDLWLNPRTPFTFIKAFDAFSSRKPDIG